MELHPLELLQQIEDGWGLDLPETLEDRINFLKREFRFLDIFLTFQSFTYEPHILEFTRKIQAMFQEAAVDLKIASEIQHVDSVTSQVQENILLTKLEIRSEYSFPKVSPNKEGVTTPRFVMKFIDTVVENLGDLVKIHGSSSLLYVPGPKKKLADLFKELKLLRNFVRFVSDRCKEPNSQHTDFFSHVFLVVGHAAMVAWLYLPSKNNKIPDLLPHGKLNDLLSELLLMKIKPIQPGIREIYTDVLQALRSSIQSQWPRIIKLKHVADCRAGFVETLQHNLKVLPICERVVALTDQIVALQEMLSLLISNLIHLSIEDIKFHLQDIDTVMVDSAVLVYSLYDSKEKEEVTLDFLHIIKRIKMVIYHIIRKEFQSNLPRIHGLGYVDFLLNNLKEFLDRYFDSLALFKTQLQIIQTELESLQPFLKSVAKERNTDKIQRSVALLIGKAYEVEYILDACVSKNVPDWCIMLWLLDIIEEIMPEVGKIMPKKMSEIDLVLHDTDAARMTSELARTPLSNAEVVGFEDVLETLRDQQPTGSREHEIVGFEDVIETLRDQLTMGSRELNVISIIGMPGAGKTTLANRMYFDNSVVSWFPIRARCVFPQLDSRRDRLLSILATLPVSIDENSLRSKDIDDLEDMLYKSLCSRRYLILLDDVWDIGAWDDLKNCFADANNGSRILLTTRSYDVANYVKSSESLHLRWLSNAESWKLLQLKVFGNESCSPLLQNAGQKIASKCGGLPLVIVLVAAFLAKMEQTEICWSLLAEELDFDIVNDSKGAIEQIYQDLPYYLMPCFLYFGTFLEDKEINVSKLTWLWIGEGFIKDCEDQSLQDRAERYLENLIRRNLVIDAKRSSDGKVKACRVHDLLLHFCRKKAKEEYLLLWMNWEKDTKTSSAICSHKQLFQRRLAFADADNLVEWSSSCLPVGSVLYREEPEDTSKNFSSRQLSRNLHNFKFLKVLDLESIVIYSFPTVLFYLRYFAAQTAQEFNTSSIANLWNLETLILKPEEGKLRLPITLWKMAKLRHLKIDNPHFNLSVGEEFLESLETLSSPCFSCVKDVELLSRRTPNLRELKCSFVDIKHEFFPKFEFLTRLETLKIHLATGSMVGCSYNFPSSLRNLTLSNFFLGTCQKSNISKLPNLHRLKLVSIFFDEDKWLVNNDEFQTLKVLKLVKCDLFEEWEVSDDAFPSLEYLVLHECPYIKKIPICFQDSCTLKSIRVTSCNESIDRSAMDIGITQFVDYCNHGFEVFIKENRLVNNVLSEACEIKKIEVTVPEVAKTSSNLLQSLSANTPRADGEMEGFQDAMYELMKPLFEGSPQLDVVSIVGIPGLGKTTLAKKIYNDPIVTSFFDVRAQCCVTQIYSRRELLVAILNGVGEHADRSEKEDGELADELRRFLLTKRFLILIDDVWDSKIWDNLRMCFKDTQCGGRIILTTQVSDIANYAKCESEPHHLRLFRDDESWTLLQKEVFEGGRCPPELRDVGVRIAKLCRGLPLSVVLVAGVLKQSKKKVDCWEVFEESLGSKSIGSLEQSMSIIGFSYKNLPHHLKPCFLYFGGFLKGKDIQVSKLSRLWQAECFLQGNEEKGSEDAAQDFLVDLISRNLVMGMEKRPNGKVKTCGIHDLLHTFCLEKAKEENFILQIKSEEDMFPENPNEYRLFIHAYQDEIDLRWPSDLNVHSLLFNLIGPSSSSWSYDISSIFDSFKRVKVLDLESLNLGSTFPSEIQYLVQLRYFAVQTVANSIPSYIAKLRNLETFVVRGLGGVMILPSSLMKMVKLRHINVHHCVPFGLNEHTDESLANSQLANLETFSTPHLSYGEDAEKNMRKMPNLRKLSCIFSGTFGSSNQMKGRCVLFPRLEFLSRLESLKLVSNGYPAKLPHEFNFPSKLRELTLSEFRLPWTQISTIAELPNLEILKLCLRAFEGNHWDVNDSEFPELKYLKLDNLTVAEWFVSDDAFPKLERLVLMKCKQLEDIPFHFGDAVSLRSIEVNWCSWSVANSAQEIQRIQHEEFANDAFTVTIQPPDWARRSSL